MATIKESATINYVRRLGPDAWALGVANDRFQDTGPDTLSDVAILGKVVAMLRGLP